METIVDDLFSTLGVHFDTSETPSKIFEIRCYGVIRIYLNSWKIWVLKRPISLGINQWMNSVEMIEAWLVDAPTGDHIIIVESQNDVNQLSMSFWGYIGVVEQKTRIVDWLQCSTNY